VRPPPVRVGFALPQRVEGPPLAAPDLVDLARAAETLEFDGIWVSELTTVPLLDPLLVLASVAAATERIRLGVAVLLAALRSPVRLAQEIATLDRLAAGRLTLGVGLGSNPALYAPHGLSPERRLRRYLDAIDLMQELWSGRPVSAETDWWSLDNVIGTTPVQRPRPTLWFGARRGQALRRAAIRGDGWIISGSAPAHEYRPAIDEVEAVLRDRGRDRADFTIAKRVYIAVADDRERAFARTREWFARHYGRPELADAVAVVDDVEGCVRELDALAGLGIDYLVLNPIFDEQKQLQALGRAVVPHLAVQPATP
jgi:alkanesulfonate monooxygenase SsuD/methylene tetrahydromethanopterin reductase-like flavin-dependent oxidoreductase (luciferase family)